MEQLTHNERIMYALYSIRTEHTAIQDGLHSPEYGQKIVKKCWNTVTKEEVMEYFKSKSYRRETSEVGIPFLDSKTPNHIKDEIARECWEALEYFNLI